MIQLKTGTIIDFDQISAIWNEGGITYAQVGIRRVIIERSTNQTPEYLKRVWEGLSRAVSL